ncbi:MAG TPA: glycosyltransferase family 4 protein [Casimicrobiaceae bacterium]|nr:glycosyltransferase family 4 protein [Casimicrobiaceae bacterium]
MGTELVPELSQRGADPTVSQPVARLVIHGWRFIHHSYAIVAQSHALALLRRGDVDLRFVDLPFPTGVWKRSEGILDAEDERQLSSLRPPDAGFSAAATLRYARDFSAPATGRAFVFDTPEFRVLRPGVTRKLRATARDADRVHMLVPSRWAGEAYLRFGIAPERVHVVPHGIDPRVLHPDGRRREASRRELGVAGGFVFLSVGAMTDNKGIDLLLRGFARVASRHADAWLVLKGADDLYASGDRVRRALDALRTAERETVASRLSYLGDRRSARDMANLLRAADCYVSPYLAEGFNMPVLEAAACGVPVICTAGGATDDFISPSFAWRIRSTLQRARTDLGVGEVLQPDIEHLVELMAQAVADPGAAQRMGAAGALHAARDYTWDRVTGRLVEVLFH